MSEIISWGVSILVVLLLVTAVWYIYGLLKLPVAKRPRTPTYDRFGEEVAVEENPDYHVHTNSGQQLSQDGEQS